MLGMGPRDGWTGWDRVEALLPEAELSGLRGRAAFAKPGPRDYEAEFDHLAELNGPLADKVIKQSVPSPPDAGLTAVPVSFRRDGDEALVQRPAFPVAGRTAAISRFRA